MNYRTHIGEILTLAGLVPFIGLSLLLAISQPIMSQALTLNLFQHYGFLIAVFIAGSHWGLHLSQTNDWRFILPVSSNIATLVLWVALSILDVHGRLWILLLSFLGLLMVDRGLYNDQIIKQSYFVIRVWATLVVSVCIITVKVSL